jgi:hypothetical protein
MNPTKNNEGSATINCSHPELIKKFESIEDKLTGGFVYVLADTSVGSSDEE